MSAISQNSHRAYLLNSSLSSSTLGSGLSEHTIGPVDNKFIDYRCIDPVVMGPVSSLWYNDKVDVCPCSNKDSGKTGRGYTSCPLGVQFDLTNIRNFSEQKKPVIRMISHDNGTTYQTEHVTVKDIQDSGSFYPTTQYSAPQAEPRPLIRIGQEWRSSW